MVVEIKEQGYNIYINLFRRKRGIVNGNLSESGEQGFLAVGPLRNLYGQDRADQDNQQQDFNQGKVDLCEQTPALHRRFFRSHD